MRRLLNLCLTSLLASGLTLVVLTSGVSRAQDAVSVGGAFQPNENYVLGGVWTWRGGSPLKFQGATNDAFTTTFALTDPTANRTWTFDDVTDQVVGRATTDTLTNKTLTAPVLGGSVTGTYTLAGTPTFTAPTINNPVINITPVAGGASLTLTAATHGGKTVLFDTASGTTLTLPAATGSGVRFTLLVSVAATSNQHRVNVVGNDAFFGGFFGGNDSDNTTVMWPTAADADQINMNGAATCGFKGARIVLEDMVTDGWSVIGWSDCSGTEATPFTTGAVS